MMCTTEFVFLRNPLYTHSHINLIDLNDCCVEMDCKIYRVLLQTIRENIRSAIPVLDFIASDLISCITDCVFSMFPFCKPFVTLFMHELVI